MRRISLSLLILFALVHIACSYVTDFAVVNESSQPIEVQYKFKRYPGDEPLTLLAPPTTITASQLSSKGANQWRKLSVGQYQIDEGSRAVIVRVMPGEALRITGVHKYSGHEDPWEAESFPVEKISIAGANGGLTFTGQLARTSFSEVSRALYTLTYK